MELAFRTKRLRALCEDEVEAQEEFGPAVAEALKHRLADLWAATSSRDLIAGNPQVIDGKAGRMTLDLPGGCVLEFAANHPKLPRDQNGDVDWRRVSQVLVVEIGGGDE